MMHDGGESLRRLCLILSEQSRGTPVSFWLDMPLWELADWTETSLGLLREKTRGMNQ